MTQRQLDWDTTSVLSHQEPYQHLCLEICQNLNNSILGIRQLKFKTFKDFTKDV